MTQPAIHPTSRHTDPAKSQAGLPILITLFALIAFVPGAVFYLVPVPSYSFGLALACMVILGMMGLGVIQPLPRFGMMDFLGLLALIAVILGAHLVVAAFFVPVEFGRAVQSMLLLMLILFSAAPIAGALHEHRAWIDSAAAWLRILLVLIAALGLARIQPPQYGIAISEERSVFPFAEPSHFALAYIPFLVHACARLRGLHRLAWLVGSLVLAFVMKSLSLVLGTILAAAICFPFSWLTVLSAAGLTVLPLVSLSYFTDRLNFALSSNNISSLVYRQGWELVADAIHRTSGWGVGFQQLGFVPFSSPAADAIYLILKDDSNLRDGSFLAAKLLSEFGLLGGLLLLAFLTLALFAALKVRKHATDRDPDADAAEIFARTVICGVVVEVMVRGLGYFSGSLLLCVSAYLLLVHKRSAVSDDGPVR